MSGEADVEAPLIDGSHPSFSDVFCPNSRQTLRICLNLKHLIDKIIPILFNEDDILNQGSPIINSNVIELAYRAAGGKGDGKPGTSSYKYRAALVFCLLKVTDWYWQQSVEELYDNELYTLRAKAAQQIAKIIIEEQTNDEYLFLGMLCHRYTISLCEVDAPPISVLELAVDMHSTIVIGSAGYQRCIKWLWRGWIIQSATDPHSYVLYKGVSSHSIRTHFDPERVKTPLYQNIIEIFFSIVYLVLYSIILNGHQESTTPLDGFEVVFYLFTIGLILDEFVKIYHVGMNYVGFWNVFNDSMYVILVIAITFRFLSLDAKTQHGQERLDEMSFRILSCAAPFMWTRLLLFLDAQRFVGAMIVVFKTMMKESVLFFVLAGVVIIGFTQGFLGLDKSDGKNEATKRIVLALIKTVIGASGFEDFSTLVPPYASIMYYVYSFLITVILMNILIALYSTAYAAIVENATDEYFALVAQKTLRYIRAPDQDLYVPPLNLIEFVFSPLYYTLSKRHYKALNYYLMLFFYSPLLAYIAIDELSVARRIQYNRYKGLPDDANEVDSEWDLTDGYDADSSDGIEERDEEVNQALIDQHAGEQSDPEFKIDLKKFYGDIDSVAQPVTEANKAGIKWEFFELYNKIDKLSGFVEEVVEENRKLRKELDFLRDSTPESKPDIKTEVKKETK
ncbi:calcium channel Yvc1p [[Candida] railenensis]|uniref:Calcium channel Yvc1p n=1 Tax=[Candida] railenensis TaxID=45579 RepID=A0A9P0QVX6_9ASCO|nr:calcium channel Yvc1p [[Candida] railenensis]